MSLIDFWNGLIDEWISESVNIKMVKILKFVKKNFVKLFWTIFFKVVSQVLDCFTHYYYGYLI